MTRKDYIVIAEAIIDMYKNEIDENRSSAETDRATNIICNHLNRNYSNFNAIVFKDYINNKIGIQQ